jgi:hypothetical protein
VEQGVRPRWQRKIPGVAQLEVEEQGPAKADAIEHFREDIHASTLIPRTVRHNIWTIAP